MAIITYKHQKKSKYKNVYEITQNGKTYFRVMITINGNKKTAYYEDEKEAAKSVDLFLITHGKEPVNILKKVN